MIIITTRQASTQDWLDCCLLSHGTQSKESMTSFRIFGIISYVLWAQPSQSKLHMNLLFGKPNKPMRLPIIIIVCGSRMRNKYSTWFTTRAKQQYSFTYMYQDTSVMLDGWERWKRRAYGQNTKMCNSCLFTVGSTYVFASIRCSQTASNHTLNCIC